MEEDVIDTNTCYPPPPVEVNSYDRPPSVPPPSAPPPSVPPPSAPPPSAPLPLAPLPSAPPSSAPFPSAPPPSTSITSAPPPSAPLPSATPPSAPPPSTPPPSATPLPDTPPSAPPPSAPTFLAPPPLAPPSPLSVEIPIYSPFDEPPPYKPLEAAPVYKLQSDYVLAKVGESPRIRFTLTSEPLLSCDSHHIITHRDGRAATSRFKEENMVIMFNNVQVSDSDVYCISCRNSAGLEGKALIQLKVYEASQRSPNVAVLSQPRWSRRTVNPQDEHAKKLNSYMKKWFIIYMLVIMVGGFLLWTIPCCIGVVAAFAVAGYKYDKRRYEESEKCMKIANRWFAGWILSAMVGAVLIITLSIVL